MECDDTKDTLCSYTTTNPGFPLSQVHLVMWEAQGTTNKAMVPMEVTVTKKTGSVTVKESLATSYASGNSAVKFTEVSVKSKLNLSENNDVSIRSEPDQVDPDHSKLSNVLPDVPSHRTSELLSKPTGRSAVEERLHKMRQKFLTGKAAMKGHIPKNQSIIIVAPPAPPDITTIVGKNQLKTNSTSVKLLDPKTPAQLKPALARSESHIKMTGLLSDNLSDRVLKFLPKGKFPSLPTWNHKPMEKCTFTSRKNMSNFQGYVPKTSPKAKTPEQKISPMKDSRKSKNVKFSLDEKKPNVEATTVKRDGVVLKITPRRIPYNIPSEMNRAMQNLNAKMTSSPRQKSVTPNVIKKSLKSAIPGISPISCSGAARNITPLLISMKDAFNTDNTGVQNGHTNDTSPGNSIHNSISPVINSSIFRQINAESPTIGSIHDIQVATSIPPTNGFQNGASPNTTIAINGQTNIEPRVICVQREQINGAPVNGSIPHEQVMSATPLLNGSQTTSQQIPQMFPTSLLPAPITSVLPPTTNKPIHPAFGQFTLSPTCNISDICSDLGFGSSLSLSPCGAGSSPLSFSPLGGLQWPELPLFSQTVNPKVNLSPGFSNLLNHL